MARGSPNAPTQTRRAKRVRDETMTPNRRCLQSACSARVSFLESNLISGNPLFSRQAVIIIVHHLCNDPPACLPLRSSGLCGSRPSGSWSKASAPPKVADRFVLWTFSNRPRGQRLWGEPQRPDERRGPKRPGLAERRCSVTRRQGCPKWHHNAIGAFTAAAWLGIFFTEEH